MKNVKLMFLIENILDLISKYLALNYPELL